MDLLTEFYNKYKYDMYMYENIEQEQKYIYQYNEFLKTHKINKDYLHNDNGYYEKFIASYYRLENIDIDKMQYYYNIAIDKGNINAMVELGEYYQFYEKNKYDLMKQYYLTAINKGNSDAMYNLGIYYEEIEKKYDLMKQYYIMAIQHDNYNAYERLYEYIEFSLSTDEEDLLEILELSIKINNFNTFNHIDENKLYTQFCNLEYIDKIYPYIDKFNINQRLKQNIKDFYLLKQSYLLNINNQFNQLPIQLKLSLLNKNY